MWEEKKAGVEGRGRRKRLGEEDRDQTRAGGRRQETEAVGKVEVGGSREGSTAMREKLRGGGRCQN